ncbi:uncharacterized protein EV154DRAFT_579951 [Mucor mucedo]|uniref:uncharacterized protein n=1 Tax=Mucor mucedo TaxID=29922 RepID=UPI002221162A|nr:uncharacterized protein EV154DRAFT_579951 [Mucor mucedo]KAI7894148.1 hypothetical protein EV154DRAFT_579951 [Mucor mucedo]
MTKDSNSKNKTIIIRVQVAQSKLFTKNENEGFRELYKLRHHKEAYYPLACYYEQHHDDEKAYAYFEKCQNKYRMALILKRQSKEKQSLHYMVSAANDGNKYAQFMMGLYFQHGSLVKQSIQLAKMWYQRSANTGFAEAQTALSNLLIHQAKLENNPSLIQDALFWLSKAEAQENASALIRLGSLHEEGILVQQDDLKSINYYKRAAISPCISPPISSFAHYLVGINYRLGDLGLEQDTNIAFKHLTISSNLGFSHAQRALGLMYAKGIGTEKNLNLSHKLLESASSQGDLRSLSLMAHTKETLDSYHEAAEMGSLSCQIALAFLLQSKHQYTLAFKWFQIAAKGTPTTSSKKYGPDSSLEQCNIARLMLARYTYNGWGVKKDVSWAINELKELSANDFKEAHYWLAAWYEEEKDLDKSLALYTKGAISGDVDCQFQVAYMLSNGYQSNSTCIKDVEAAFSWYLKAAENGHKTAQYSAGLYYENGLFMSVDLKKAIYWYTRAAKQDITLAMVRLARLVKSTDKVVYWLTTAIDKGDISALRELATFYKNGLIEGYQQHQEAFDLFQKAAYRDDAMSWHALSEFYEQGIIVPVNLEKAVSCLEKAEVLGYSVAALDLAELYCRNKMMEDALIVYTRLTEAYSIKSTTGWNARLKFSRMIIFEDGGTEKDQLKVYSWLMHMQYKRNKPLAQVFEFLGYCTENGKGTAIDKDVALHWYISCVEAKEFDWAKQRSLCRLVSYYMDQKDYASAYYYLEILKPDLDDMRQLSTDANIQARRVKYFLGYLLMYGLGTERNIQSGVSWITSAADDGDNDAVYELGKYYSTINEEEEAKHRYEEGIGHAGCMRALAMILLSEESDQPDEYEDYDGGAHILGLLESAANMGDTEAIYQLGIAHEDGLGSVTLKDSETALAYYIKAATGMHELAMVKAGEILSNSLGRYEDSIYWFQKAVNLTNNIKAKVMLVSFDFQGHSKTDKNDMYHFEVLRNMIHEEMANMEEEDSQANDQQLTMRKEGLGLAFYILGQCYELGRGTPVNISLAIEWYRRSVLISQHVEAMWRLGIIYSNLEGDKISALEWFRKAAEKGKHRDSHYQLGLYHLNGLGGLERNIIAAQKYFSKASDGGHPLATFELARIVWNRNDDHVFGYELFRLAAQLGVSDALRELGHLSHRGFSSEGITIVHQDYKRAFGYYCEAAQKGDPTAALMVGNYFEEGYLKEELGQDCERALQWYESAYRLNGGGLTELAIGKLKHIMAESINDPKEADDMREEAFVWFESAAISSINKHQGFCAKVMVALYYLNGWGRKSQDTQTGLSILLDIAKAGGSVAFVPIARCYEEGIGTERDMLKSIAYWEMAADMGNHEAVIRINQSYEAGLSGQNSDYESVKQYYDATKMTNRPLILGLLREI